MSSSMGSNIFQIPVKISVSRTKIGNVEQIMEDAMNVKEETEGDLKKDEEDDDKPGNDKKPQLEPILTLDTDSFFRGRKFVACTFFHCTRTIKYPSRSLRPKGWGNKPRRRGQGRQGDEARLFLPKVEGLERYYHTAIAVIFESRPEWAILGLSGLMDLYDEICCDDVTATQLFRWSLPASASAFALDDDRSVLLIGSRDGTLCMWNLTTRSLTSIVGRHETAVSCISLLRCAHNSGTQSDHFLVSGAEDGTLCIFHLNVPLKGPELREQRSRALCAGH